MIGPSWIDENETDEKYIYIQLKDCPRRKDLQVLCMNCNWATRFGKECPHGA